MGPVMEMSEYTQQKLKGGKQLSFNHLQALWMQFTLAKYNRVVS